MKTAIIVGESALTIQCATLLERRGITVVGVATDDPAVTAWCTSRTGTQLVRAREVSSLLGDSHDFLFSIVNAAVLPRHVVEAPRVMAINYHDSLLPRHAGSHAVMSTILAGETEAGVTWHRMVARADAGEILVQERVSVSADDTAATLNAKCALAALGSFGRLVRQLLDAKLEPAPQNQAERTFHPRYRRPLLGCVADFEAGVNSVDRFLRALSFGAGWNPLGLPKLWTESGNLYAITSHRVLPPSGEVGPSELLWLAPDRALVGVRDAAVELSTTPLVDSPAVATRDRACPLVESPSARSYDDARCREEAAWLGLYRHRPSLRAFPRPASWRSTVIGRKTRVSRDAVLGVLRECASEDRAILDVFESAARPSELPAALYAAEVPLLGLTARPDEAPPAGFLVDFDSRVRTAWPVQAHEPPSTPVLRVCFRQQPLLSRESVFDFEISTSPDGSMRIDRFGRSTVADAAEAALATRRLAAHVDRQAESGA